VSTGKTITKPPSEHDEQVGFVTWWRAKFPGVLIYAIPNGEHRAPSVANRLKAEGVVRGVPDLHVPELRLWIEMKRIKTGRLSPEQGQMIRYLESIGHTVLVGYGARDASAKVLDWIEQKKAGE
jgi:hypothetical protein